jgi:hypothetical protein
VTPVVIDASAGVELAAETARGRDLRALLPLDAVPWVPKVFYVESGEGASAPINSSVRFSKVCCQSRHERRSTGRKHRVAARQSAAPSGLPYGVARREVLVQLDDDLVGRLDELARSRGTNRSELLRRGALAVLEAEDLRQADVVLQDAYRRQPQDPELVEAALRLAAVTVSEW